MILSSLFLSAKQKIWKRGGVFFGGGKRGQTTGEKKGIKKTAPDSQPSQRMFLLLPPRPLPQLPQVINYRNVGLCVAVGTVDLLAPLGRPDQPVEEEKKKVEMKEIDFPPPEPSSGINKASCCRKRPILSYSLENDDGKRTVCHRQLPTHVIEFCGPARRSCHPPLDLTPHLPIC